MAGFLDTSGAVAKWQRKHLAASEVPEDLPRRVVARRSRDAAPGVGTRAAQVQPTHRRTVVGITEHGPGREELVERERSVEDVSSDQAELAFEVKRREYLAREDARLESRRVPLDRHAYPARGSSPRGPCSVVPGTLRRC